MKALPTFILSTSLALGAVVGFAPAGQAAPVGTPLPPSVFTTPPSVVTIPPGYVTIPPRVTVDPCILKPDSCKPKKPPVRIDPCKLIPGSCKPGTEIPDEPKDPEVPPGTTPDPVVDPADDPIKPTNPDKPVKGRVVYTG